MSMFFFSMALGSISYSLFILATNAIFKTKLPFVTEVAVGFPIICGTVGAVAAIMQG